MKDLSEMQALNVHVEVHQRENAIACAAKEIRARRAALLAFEKAALQEKWPIDKGDLIMLVESQGYHAADAGSGDEDIGDSDGDGRSGPLDGEELVSGEEQVLDGLTDLMRQRIEAGEMQLVAKASPGVAGRGGSPSRRTWGQFFSSLLGFSGGQGASGGEDGGTSTHRP